jgi:hypothetical protein
MMRTSLPINSPYWGRPAQYEICFRLSDMTDKHGSNQTWIWFREECIPVIKNLTGNRAHFKHFSAFVDDKADYEMIKLFFTGFVERIIDWKMADYVFISNPSDNLPDL